MVSFKALVVFSVEMLTPSLFRVFATFLQRVADRLALAPSLSKSKVSQRSNVTALRLVLCAFNAKPRYELFSVFSMSLVLWQYSFRLRVGKTDNRNHVKNGAENMSHFFYCNDVLTFFPISSIQTPSGSLTNASV